MRNKRSVTDPLCRKVRALLRHPNNRGVKFTFDDVARSVHARPATIAEAIGSLENKGYVIVHRGLVWWPLSIKQTMTSLDRPDYHCGPLADGNARSGSLSQFWFSVAHPRR